MSLSSIDGHVCWNSNHRWPFIVCQPRKTNVHFPFPFTANNVSLPVPFSICRKQRKLLFSVETWTWRHEDMDTWRHWYVKTWRQGDMDMETSNGKWKTEAQAILLNLHFIDFWLSVCRRRKKRTKWTCPMPVYVYKVQSPVNSAQTLARNIWDGKAACHLQRVTPKNRLSLTNGGRQEGDSMRATWVSSALGFFPWRRHVAFPSDMS
jgi:hypothetical protein